MDLVIIDEGFELMDAGAPPFRPPWDVQVPTSSDAVEIVTSPVYAGTKALKIHQASTSEYCYARIIDNWYENDGTGGTIDFYLQAAQTDKRLYITTYTAGGMAIYIYLRDNGTIYYYDGDGSGGGTWTLCSTGYSSGSWLHLTIDYDNSTDSWDLTIDGTSEGTGIGYRYSSSGGMEQIRFSGHSSYAPATFYVDNLYWEATSCSALSAAPASSTLTTSYAQTALFEDDCSSLANWIYSAPDTGDSVSVDTTTYFEGGSSIKIYEAGGSGNTYIEKTISNSHPIGTVRFYIRKDETDKHFYIYGDFGTTHSITVRFGNDGWISYYDGSAYRNIATYSAATWYLVEIIYDCDKETFEVWINNELVREGCQFRDSADYIDKIRFTGSYPSSPSTTWIDEVRWDLGVRGFPTLTSWSHYLHSTHPQQCRAIVRYNSGGTDRLFVPYMDRKYQIRCAQLTTSTLAIEADKHVKTFSSDPVWQGGDAHWGVVSAAIDKDGKICLVYGGHGDSSGEGEHLYFTRSLNAGNINVATPWDTEVTIAQNTVEAGYGRLLVDPDSGNIYCLYRRGYDPGSGFLGKQRFSYRKLPYGSTSWEAEKTIIESDLQTGECDWKMVYVTNCRIGRELQGTKSIHLVWDFSHYYDLASGLYDDHLLQYLESLDGGTAWRKADGTLITSNSDTNPAQLAKYGAYTNYNWPCELVWGDTGEGDSCTCSSGASGKIRRMMDVAQDDFGNIYLFYTRDLSTDEVWLAKFDKSIGAWSHHQLTGFSAYNNQLLVTRSGKVIGFTGGYLVYTTDGGSTFNSAKFTPTWPYGESSYINITPEIDSDDYKWHVVFTIRGKWDSHLCVYEFEETSSPINCTIEARGTNAYASWTQAGGADNYRFYYGLKSDGTYLSPGTQYGAVSEGSQPLTSGHRFYVRVQGEKTDEPYSLEPSEETEIRLPQPICGIL